MAVAAVVGTTSMLWLLAPSVRETRLVPADAPSSSGLELGVGTS
jgi:hypothetical protein